MQSMSTNCKLTDGPNNYVAHHNPAVYYKNVRSACAVDDVPITHLADDVDTLPKFGMVVPDKCHDGHGNDCAGGSTKTGTAHQADDYLQSVLPTILNGASYQGGHTLVVVTFDEGSGSNQTVYTVFIGRSLDGQVITANLTHYSLLRYIESHVGVGCLKNACSAPQLVLP
jgi:hypothetical protein